MLLILFRNIKYEGSYISISNKISNRNIDALYDRIIKKSFPELFSFTRKNIDWRSFLSGWVDGW